MWLVVLEVGNFLKMNSLDNVMMGVHLWYAQDFLTRTREHVRANNPLHFNVVSARGVHYIGLHMVSYGASC